MKPKDWFELATINLAAGLIIGMMIYIVYREHHTDSGKGDLLTLNTPKVTVIHKNTEVN